MNWKIFPLGENALTVEFGNIIAPEINNQVLKLARFVEQNNFAGFVEMFPAYASLTIFYDLREVRKNFPEFPTAFAAVKNFVENALPNLAELPEIAARLIEIPVSFKDEDALDLACVAAQNNLSKIEVIEIFTARIYRVYMLGFLPGFAYMGEIDKRIRTPRKVSPRLEVPKGSVGIAGVQTGIYSLRSPGGWQIIGRTDVEMFTPHKKSPTFLQAGDSIKFFQSNL